MRHLNVVYDRHLNCGVSLHMATIMIRICSQFEVLYYWEEFMDDDPSHHIYIILLSTILMTFC